MTYEQAVDYIINIPRFSDGTTERGKGGNDNLKKVLMLLGNPQNSCKSIHIAGTNGKGSVSVYTAEILRACGYKTGLFTSPHLIKVNERIKIDGIDISDEDFLQCFNIVQKAIAENEKQGGFGLSFFEYLFAIAAVYFQKNNPDYVIYETGLGGRLDATNTIWPEITAITSIGMDHTQYLGDTIEKIAKEKAGIIKEGIPVVYNTGCVEADAVIEKRAKKLSAECNNVAKTDYMINENGDNGIDFSLTTVYYNYQMLKLQNQIAIYQMDNAVTAIVLCNRLICGCGIETDEEQNVKKSAPVDTHNRQYISKESLKREHISVESLNKECINRECIQKGLDNFNWPGRMEKLCKGVVVDGAHNSDAIHRFVESVLYAEGQAKIVLLFAVAGDKDYEPMIEELCGRLNVDTVCVTTLNSSRGISAEYIAKLFSYYNEKIGKKAEVVAVEHIEKALKLSYDKARMEKCKLYCVGSLYLVGSIEELIQEVRIDD